MVTVVGDGFYQLIYSSRTYQVFKSRALKIECKEVIEKEKKEFATSKKLK